MSTFYFPTTETPLFWDTLVKGYDKYPSLGPLSATWPGTLLDDEVVASYTMLRITPLEAPQYVHQLGCKDPYGNAAWCDCNNLTREDAYVTPRVPMHLRVVPGGSTDLVICDCGSSEMYCERVPDPMRPECLGCDDPGCQAPRF